MGGILARAYIQGGHYDNDVDALITLRTPHFGSSDVYTIWEGGHIPKNWDIVQRSLFNLYFFLKFKATNDADKYDAVHTALLSLRDLLPTYNYLRDKVTNDLKQTTSLQEQNTTLNTFNATIDDLNFLVGSMITIAGNNISTVGEMPVIDRDADEDPLWADGKPYPLDPERNADQGDNRVLLSSAHLPVIPSDNQITLPNAKHGDLPSRSAQTVFDRLGFADPGTLALVPEPDDILAFMFASPVMPTVTDPNGDTITLGHNSIPGAIYVGEPDPAGLKMILIANPRAGAYKIDLLGNGNGQYDFASAYFKHHAPDSMQTFSGDIVEGERITYRSTLDIGLEHPLTTTFVDQNPPAINIAAPENGKAYRNDGMIAVNVSIIDESKLATRQLQLDASPTANGQTIDLSLLKLGTHVFTVSATDEHGNEGHATSTFTTFVTHDSLKTNIKHYADLGLVKQQTTSAALLALVEARRLVRTVRATSAIVKTFETTVRALKTSNLILEPAATLLIEQMKSL